MPLNIPSQTSTARTTVRRPSGMRVLFRAVSRHARKHGGHCRRVESRAPLRHHAARRDLDELPGTDGGAVVFLGRHPALRCTPQPRPLGSRIRTGALWRPCRGIPKRRARGLGRGLGRHRRPGRVPLVARRWRQQVAPELRPILSSYSPLSRFVRSRAAGMISVTERRCNLVGGDRPSHSADRAI